MASANKVILIGNLTRDPQLKFLPSNTAVCELGLAVNRNYTTAGGEKREEVTYVDCTAFGKQAEVLNQYMEKGKPLYIEGRLKFDSWEKDGQKRSKLTVVIEQFQFLGGREGGEQAAPRDDGDQRPQTMRDSIKDRRQPVAASDVISNEQKFKDDDIPF
jgi:single-strand DNA-binding protein